MLGIKFISPLKSLIQWQLLLKSAVLAGILTVSFFAGAWFAVDSQEFKNYLSGYFSVKNVFGQKMYYLADCYTQSCGTDTALEGVDSATFKRREGAYFTDKNKVYFQGKVVAGADPATFTTLPGYSSASHSYSFSFAKDAMHVYDQGERMFEADVDTFTVLDEWFAKDQNHVYWKNNILADADPKTFTVINTYYSKDNTHVFFLRDKIEGADPKTFQFLDGEYSKDVNTAYNANRKLEGVDAATFEVLYDLDGNINHVKDKNRVYRTDGLIIENIDTATVKVLDYRYIQDKNGFYYNGSSTESMTVPRELLQ